MLATRLLVAMVGALLIVLATSTSSAAPQKQFIAQANLAGMEVADATNDPDKLMQLTLEIIRGRLAQLTGKNYRMSYKGGGRLIIELPQHDSRKLVEAALGIRPALHFKILDLEPRSDQQLIGTTSADSEAFSRAAALPSKTERISDRNVIGAFPSIDAVTREPVVLVEFDEMGSKWLAEITKKHVGRRLAIFLDGKVLAVPEIREAIVGGRMQLSGGFTFESANELAIKFSGGRLPIPFVIVEDHQLD